MNRVWNVCRFCGYTNRILDAPCPYAPEHELVVAIEQGTMDVTLTQTQNARGEWVPAIPLPFYGLRKKCWTCGAKFWTTNRYREHYALHHILDPDPA